MTLSDTPLQISPVTLRGNIVQLEPLTLAHAAALSDVGLDPELWRWIPSPVTTPQQMRAYVQSAIDDQGKGVCLPFAVIDVATGTPIGSTRYGNIERAHKRLEIGWTWYTASRQRTGVNTEAKYLLLAHAFEVLGMNRVELKTDALNEKSRNAIGRIGAKQEGILRQHLVTGSGRVRDTVYFSIVKSEWEDAKARLLELLRR